MTGPALTIIALAALLFSADGRLVATGQEPKVPPATPEILGRTAGQPVNVKVDLVVMEQRAGEASTSRTSTMTIADRDRGQLRTTGGGEQILNVDAQPEIVREGRIRVRLTFDYRAPRTETDRTPPMLTQSVSSIVEDGRPLTVAQWTEAGSNRVIRVELHAAIQK